MVISNKPKKKTVDVDALINKGGSVAAKETMGAASTLLRLQLRLPPNILARIDKVIARRVAKPSRHFWLLEAIEEKLEREEQP